MKILLLTIMACVTISFTYAQNDWLLGHEIELGVKLTYVEYGDMSTYIGFKTGDGKEGENKISFAYWTWNAGEGSIKKEIEAFDGDEGSDYKITLQYPAIKELEYRGFEEGNVETGEISNEWVLTKIVGNN
tara:strand:- start:865 stop:1257 length:393 start_codon:yes stop_codon:yes gene_type:complete